MSAGPRPGRCERPSRTPRRPPRRERGWRRSWGYLAVDLEHAAKALDGSRFGNRVCVHGTGATRVATLPACRRVAPRGARPARRWRATGTADLRRGFAGLAVARELAGSGARVLVLDRYEIGEQTFGLRHPHRVAADAGPDGARIARRSAGSWSTPPRNLGPGAALDVLHLRLPRALPAALGAVGRRLRDRQGRRPHREHGAHRSWRPKSPAGGRCPGMAAGCSALRGFSRRTLHSPRPRGAPLGVPARRWSCGSTASTCRRIRLELPGGRRAAHRRRLLRPRFHVKDTTVLLAEELEREPVRFQGNWIPHKLREATEDGIFLAGDSAGHCLPLTAEGIRTAFYFGLACRRELRAVVEASPAAALVRAASFSASHEWKFRCMLLAQRGVPRVPPQLLHRESGQCRRAASRLVVRPLPGDSATGVRHAEAAARGAPRCHRADRGVSAPCGSRPPAPPLYVARASATRAPARRGQHEVPPSAAAPRRARRRRARRRR